MVSLLIRLCYIYEYIATDLVRWPHFGPPELSQQCAYKIIQHIDLLFCLRDTENKHLSFLSGRPPLHSSSFFFSQFLLLLYAYEFNTHADRLFVCLFSFRYECQNKTKYSRMQMSMFATFGLVSRGFEYLCGWYTR